MLVWLMMTGCVETEFLISGEVTDARDGGAPVSGADVTLRDMNGERYSEATTDSDGRFEAAMPPQQLFFMVADAEGFVPTSFAGLSAAAPLEIIEGEVWLRNSSDLESIRATFDGCAPPTLGEGGIIEGEVRLYVLAGQESETLPLVTTATVTAFTADGVAISGCYLDDEGVSAPESGVTGETGRFALFNIPAGTISINISYDYGGAEPQEDWYVMYAPEGGVVPIYPALSSMP